MLHTRSYSKVTAPDWRLFMLYVGVCDEEQEILKCVTLTLLESADEVTRVSYGASTLIRRDRGKADLAGPPVLASNIAVPSLHASKRSVYFLPDRIVIRDGHQYADMPYQHCRITGTPTRFMETGRVPADAERVGTTWKYVNKGGGPDRRYKNNPQLPIMRYGELTLTAQPGFNFMWQTSRAAATPSLSAAFAAISAQGRHGGTTR